MKYNLIKILSLLLVLLNSQVFASGKGKGMLDVEICRIWQITQQSQNNQILDCLASKSNKQKFNAKPALKSLLRPVANFEINFPRLRNVLHHPLTMDQLEYYVELIHKHHNKESVPELLRYLPQDITRKIPRRVSALNAILSFDEPAAWNKAREIIEKLYRDGGIVDGRYNYAKHQLDFAINNKLQKFQQNKEAQLSKTFKKEESRLWNKYRNNQSLRKIDAKQYIQQKGLLIGEFTDLADRYSNIKLSGFLKVSIQREILSLAQYARDNEFYEVALKEFARVDDVRSYLNSADIYRFIYKNNQSAIDQYKKALGKMNADILKKSEFEKIYSFYRKWVEHDIVFLQTGKSQPINITFNGLRDFSTSMYFSSLHVSQKISLKQHVDSLIRGELDKDQKWIKNYLFSLNKSPLRLLDSSRLIALLSDKNSVDTFVHKNDPGGFLIAHLYAYVTNIDKLGQSKKGEKHPYNSLARDITGNPSALLMAARNSKYQYTINQPKPDKRLNHPKGTWKVFLAALHQANKKQAYKCMTITLRNKLEPMIEKMDETNLSKLANSFKGFELSKKTGSFWEAVVNRQSQRGMRAGFVYFVEQDNTWLIHEL